MADKLYNAHTLEKTSDEISGSLMIWRDTPDSPYNIGDTFSPVEGVTLNVKKVNISDNVIGEKNGKPFRQWQVTIEGSSEEVSGGSDTNIKYTFNLSSDENSGTMEVTNKGDTPTLSLSIGQTFNVPGVGSVKCTGIKGNDSYNENGVHTWVTVYEGVSASSVGDNDNTGTKYSLSVSGTEQSASMEVTNKGSTPTIANKVGDIFSVPGFGNIECTSYKASNSFNEHGVQSWTVTYEGVKSDEDGETPVGVKYSSTKTGDGITGSMEVTNVGNKPSISLNLGDGFSIPGVGRLLCTSIKTSNEYDSKGVQKWTVTYESTIPGSDDDGSGGSGSSIPEDEESETLELNGVTVRTVDGEFLALRRSTEPVRKGSYTIYSKTKPSDRTPGSTYEKGTIISVTTTKETVKEKGTVILTYYKQTIETEA